MKKYLICSILLLILGCCFVHDVYAGTYNSNVRQKSTVMLIINNIADSKHNDALNKIMYEELHKKIDVIYKEEDSNAYVKEFLNKDNSILSAEDMCRKIGTCKSDYLIYAELKELNKTTNFNFVYHGKKIAATFYIAIVDIENRSYLYNSEYTLTAEDSTDYFFVGSGSVSKKALKKVLFRAGEAISAHLPL